MFGCLTAETSINSPSITCRRWWKCSQET